MPKPIRGLLFDKDGTLIDYHLSWMPINRMIALHAARGDMALADRLLAHGGYDAGSGRVRANTPLAAGTPDEIAACFAELLGAAARPGLSAELDRIFHENGGLSVLVPEAVPALEALRARASHMGVATSDSMAGLKSSFGHHGILDRFDFLAGYDSGHGRKPGPGMALAFCDASSLPPAEICVIGDNSHDIEMGRAAGAGLVVGVLTGTSTPGDLAGRADMVYAGIAEMAADPVFLARLGASAVVRAGGE